MRVANLVGVVLVGGQSRRLGRDKALLRLPDGSSLLERTIGVLRAAGIAETALSVASHERQEALCGVLPALRGLPVVVDTLPNQGPLGGLGAALRRYPDRHVLLVACDMPRLDAAVLRALIDEPRDAAILALRIAGRVQPLHALYSPACRTVVERLLAGGHLAMRDLLAAPELAVRYLDERWLERVGASAHIFENVNTPDDLAMLALHSGVTTADA